MLGWSPKAVNAGPRPNAGPKPNTVNAGPKPDAEPKPNALNAVNARPKPKNGVKAQYGAEALCGAEARCNKCEVKVRWENARNAKANVNAEEQRRALQSGDFDLFAVFVKRGWELSVEIPRSWMRDVCCLSCGRSIFKLPSCYGFLAMGKGNNE
ncbi:hypothetical protein CDL15_Pgr016817 [Punica granatum]|uniref:Uncharacterized protein n=1 Tax=Punica granatum TaxID=22663 RepID=A0A218WYG7_PUNGR|nr:hypothetical protein CDL15_Pgr016817 [Punica granatum]